MEKQKGYALVWILVFIASCSMSIGALTLSSEGDPETVGIWMFCISALVLCIGLVVEARHDLCEFYIGSATLAGIACVLTGTYVAVADDAGALAMIISVVTGLIAAACIYFRYRYMRSPEVLRNVLRENTKDDAILEVDGVQFVVTSTGSDIRAGGTFDVQVIAQNGWDTERILHVDLAGNRRISLNFAGLVFQKHSEITLSGGAAAVLTIPIRAEWRAKGRYPVSVSVKARGRGGKRLRRWRAKAVSSGVPLWVTMTLGLAGLLLWKGGIKIKAVVVSASDRDSGAVPAAPSSTEILWQPTQDELQEMAAVR